MAHQNSKPTSSRSLYGSNINFDGVYGGTARMDSAMPDNVGIEGGYIDLLSCEGIPQSWQSSQPSVGFGLFTDNRTNVHEGGSSQRGPDIGSTDGVRSTKEGRKKNFSDKDDLVLVSAWKNVSVDPIHGTNQSSSTYWGRITEYYNEHKEVGAIERNQKSVNARWDIISKSVSKFQGWLEQVQRRSQSGTTHADKIAEAMKVYEAHEKKHFSFMHCFTVLQNEEKWKSTMSSKKQKTSRDATPASSPAVGNYVDLDGDTPHQFKQGATRPMGCKAAKAGRRRAASSSSIWNESSLKVSYDSLNEQLSANQLRKEEFWLAQDSKAAKETENRHNETLRLEREKLDYLKDLEERKLEQALQLKQMELHQAEKNKRLEIEAQQEAMIMQLDMSKLDADSRAYYTTKKKKLMAMED